MLITIMIINLYSIRTHPGTRPTRGAHYLGSGTLIALMRAHRCARSAAAARVGGAIVGNPTLIHQNPPSSLESLLPLPPSAIHLPRDSRSRSRCALGAGSRCNRGKSSPRLSGSPPLATVHLIDRASTLLLAIHSSLRLPDLHLALQDMLRGFPLTPMAGIARD